MFTCVFFLFALILIYFLASFRFYARKDFDEWQVAADEAMHGAEEIDNKLEVAVSDMSTRQEEHPNILLAIKSIDSSSQKNANGAQDTRIV